MLIWAAQAAAQETAKKKFWILDPLYIALGTLLAFFYAVIPNYGVAIMLLTAAACVLRMPLVAKQVKSQREMQRIQPELKRLQAKYKEDPQKRNEEMMKLYKEHNVNPFAGCLPVLLQMPLFIVLYRLILNLSAQPPKHIPQASRLYRDLVADGGRLNAFGMNLGEGAKTVQGFANLLPYLVLIALVVGTGLYQQRQMTARTPAAATNTQMQVMGKIVPVFLGFISFQVPAGVVLYFLVSNLFQIGQQAVLFRRQEAVPAPGTGRKVIDTKTAAAEAGPPGGLTGLLNRLMKAPALDPRPNGPAGDAKRGLDPDGRAEDGAAPSGPGTGIQADGAEPAGRRDKGAGSAGSTGGRATGKGPAASGAGRTKPQDEPTGRAKAVPRDKAAPAAPAPAGGFLGRWFGGRGRTGAGMAPTRPASKPGPKGSSGRSSGKASANGRGGSGAAGGGRASGRAQPKGQGSSGAKSRSRNSRRGR